MRLPFSKSRSKAPTPAPTGQADVAVVEPFVGREAEFARFEEALRGGQKFLISVSGDAGMGKKTLLRRFQQTAAASGVVTAWTDRTADGVPAMLAALAEQLELRGHPVDSFGKRYRTYRQRMNELEADPQAPKELFVRAAGGAARVGVRGVRHVPGLGLPFELVPEDAAAKAASELTRYLTEKLGSNTDEVQLVREPVPVLTRSFLDDVRSAGQGARVGLFLATDETAYGEVENWLLEVARETYGKRPAGLVIAITSSRQLDAGAWVSFAREVDRIRLGPLSEEDARLLLRQQGVTNDAVVSEILRRADGVPVSLAVLAAEQPETPEQVGDPNGTVVDGFLSSIGEPARRRLAVDASLPRVLNREVLRLVWGREEDVSEDFDWLTKLPYMNDSEQGWAYSSSVRDQFLQRSRRDAPQGWTQLHRTLADYYEGLGTGLSLDDQDRALDAEWQRYELEVRYHELCAAPRLTARRELLNGFMAAFAADRRFAQHFGAAVKQAGIDTGQEWLDELGGLLAAGTAPIEGAASAAATAMFDALLASGELEDVWRAKALDWRGYLAMLEGNLEAALPDFDAAVDLRPESVEYLLDRGVTLQLLGRHEDALADLTRAAAIEPDNVRVLNVRAESYQLAERLDEALADTERVLEIQPRDTAALMRRAELFQLEGDAAEALASLDRALEIEPDNAQALAAHGRVQAALGRLEEALSDVDRAAELAPDDYGILSLRGLLLARSKRFDEAVAATRTLIALTSEFFAEYDRVLSSLSQEELERRATHTAALTGLDPRETARQMRFLADGPEAVNRTLEADLGALEGQKHLENGDGDAAIDAYARALERDPERLPLRAARVGLLLRADRLDEALAEAQRGVESAPDTWLFVGLRWAILARKGDLREAAAAASAVADHAEEYVRELAAMAALTRFGTPVPADAGPPASSSGGEQSWFQLAATDTGAAARAVRVEADAMGAAFLLSEGDIEGALARWRHAVEVDPSRSPVWHAKARLELTAGKIDDARASLDRAVETDPENQDTWRARAAFHLSQQSLDDAEADAGRAIALASHDYTLVSLKAAILNAKGDLAGFVECSRIVAEHAEEFVDQLAAMASRGGAPERLDDFGPGFAAAVASGRPLSAEDRETAARHVRADAAAVEALLLQEQDDADGAIAAWTRALDIGGPHVDRLMYRGDLHREEERFEDALADFDAMVELDADSAAGHGSRGQALAGLGRPDEALAAFDRALELDASLTWARRERAELYLELDLARPDDAVADFSRVLETAPDDLRGHVGRGRALLSLDRLDEARADLDRAIDLAPDIAFCYGIRGEIRYLLDDVDGALADFTRAAELDPEETSFKLLRSETLLLAGRSDEALASVELAVPMSTDGSDWSYYVRALAHRSLAHADAAGRDLDEAIGAVEGQRQEGSAGPEALLNAALYRLARGAPGDEVEATRLFAEVKPKDAYHRRHVLRDLRTLSRLGDNATAAEIEAQLAAAEAPNEAPAG